MPTKRLNEQVVANCARLTWLIFSKTLLYASA